MAKSKKERRDTLVRAVAIALAALLVISVLFSVLPLFGLAEEEQPRNHYALDMAIDLDAQAIAVNETLDYVNAAGRRLDAVWLNVYANALRRAATTPVEASQWNDAFPAGYAPGGVDFISVTVNGEPADWSMSGPGETFMRVGVSLENGDTARIALRFLLLLPRCNGALGAGETSWRLVNFYPVAAAYDPQTKDFTRNGWVVAADPLVSDLSDYEVSLTLPKGWTPVSTGLADVSTEADGWTTWRLHAEGVRDFSLAFGRKPEERRGKTASGLAVRACAGSGLTAQAMLDAALWAAGLYEDWLGEGAPGALTLAETDCLHPVSKPGLILIPRALCALSRRGQLEAEIARQCAKQWFGGAVGCNGENEPWLADALSGYLALLAFEEKEGYRGYLQRLNGQALTALQITIPGGLTVDSAASRFDSVSEYETVVVDRGAAVLHELRDLTGRETFLACLARYVSDNRGKIASIAQFAAAFNETTGQRWDEYLVYQLQNISDYGNQPLARFE